MTQTVSAPALEMRGITKRYPGVVANDGIDLEIRPGRDPRPARRERRRQVDPDEHPVRAGDPGRGRDPPRRLAVTIKDPSDAIARGISMVHQHFMLVPVCPSPTTSSSAKRRWPTRSSSTGRRPGAGSSSSASGSGSRSTRTSRSRRCRSAGSSGSRSSRRSTARRGSSSSTSPRPSSRRRRRRRSSRSSSGSPPRATAIIFISHKLYEVLEIADRITVIRRGKVVGERLPSETDEDDLAALMVGRNVQLVVDRGESHPQGAALSVHDLRVLDDRGHEAVKGVRSTSGPARSSASPASRATARTSSSRR